MIKPFSPVIRELFHFILFMDKKICIICGALIITSLTFTEGMPLYCDNCEKKKQPHIEQPTAIIRGFTTSIVAGVSATASTTTTTLIPQKTK